MRETILQYWWLGLSFTVLYTAWSIWWTVRANRRFRELMQSCKVNEVALEYTERDVKEIQHYLEKSPTIPNIPIIKIPANH